MSSTSGIGMRAHSWPPPAVASYWNGEPARPVHIAGVVWPTGRLLTNRGAAGST